jgi:RNase P/RNase MRP subunit POP5
MKALKPSARERKRYLLIKTTISKNKIEEIILEFIGIKGFSDASPFWIQKDILSINRESLNSIISSFAVSKEEIVVLKISGTLKGLKK